MSKLGASVRVAWWLVLAYAVWQVDGTAERVLLMALLLRAEIDDVTRLCGGALVARPTQGGGADGYTPAQPGDQKEGVR